MQGKRGDGVRLVIVKGKLEVLDYFIEGIIKEIEFQGISYHIVDLHNIAYTAGEVLSEFVVGGEVALLIFNNIGALLSEGKENFWEKYDVPIYSFIVDHPRNFGDMLHQPLRNFTTICLDKKHVSFVKRYYPKVRDAVFIPNGGTSEGGGQPYLDRTIDILYLGNCQPRVEEMPKLEFFSDGGGEFYSRCVECLCRDYDLTTEDVIESVLRQYYPDISDDALLQVNESIAIYIECIIRRHFKLQMLRALDAKGINVEIYGDDWEDGEYVYGDNIRIHPRISSAECGKWIGEAKITLNFMPWFKDGSSERPYNSMLNGSVCLIDYNPFLAESFTDGEDILFFDMGYPLEAASRIKTLLEEPGCNTLQQIAHNGYVKACQTETWANRARSILDVMMKGD